MNTHGPLNLIITGVGGQGNVLLAQLIGKALVNSEYYVTIGETFGPAQRGGAVMSHLRISQHMEYSPLIPEGQANIILGLEPVETLRVLGQFGNPRVAVITNTRPVYPIAVTGGEARYPDLEKMKELVFDLSAKVWFLNATEMAFDMGMPILANIIMAGALLGTGTVPLRQEQFLPVLINSFSKDKQEPNLQAFKRGFDLTRNDTNGQLTNS
ncbi:MAG: indolepyruvate oxidoreductase subunit beta [Thermodesulfobacteriota bacterium]|nr:indolepyruvate oxidoreductase subunit beta [Thermodesulfobacteriota bacterium]